MKTKTGKPSAGLKARRVRFRLRTSALHIRCTPEDLIRWTAAAAREGRTLSGFVVFHLNEAAKETS